MNIEIGLTGTKSIQTSQVHSAKNLGSGSVENTYGTPAMLALMEAAAVAAIEHRLDAESASVGIAAAFAHLAATPIGNTVTAVATVTAIDRRKISFNIEVHDEHELVGSGTHDRVIINRARFAQRLAAKQS